jgi:CO/xanthine dehydrogenase Mo-binding subunit
MVSGQGSTLIGAAVKRKEDPRLLTGAGTYTGDVQLRGMTYMAVLRSPHAHAHIRRIEPARARQQPGVLAVLTGHEADGPWRRRSRSMRESPWRWWWPPVVSARRMPWT